MACTSGSALDFQNDFTLSSQSSSNLGFLSVSPKNSILTCHRAFALLFLSEILFSLIPKWVPSILHVLAVTSQNKGASLYRPLVLYSLHGIETDHVYEFVF